LVSRIALIALLLILSGCGPGTYTVDGHRFSVPRTNVLSSPGGMMFVMNPDASLPAQHIILVETKAIHCPGANKAALSMLASACAAATSRSLANVPRDLRKSFPYPDYRMEWTYSERSRTGVGRMYAVCSALAKRGLCHSLNNYDDIVFSLSFRDEEIADLSALTAEVRRKLRRWEQAAG
jgi:hypothetical protein